MTLGETFASLPVVRFSSVEHVPMCVLLAFSFLGMPSRFWFKVYLARGGEFTQAGKGDPKIGGEAVVMSDLVLEGSE